MPVLMLLRLGMPDFLGIGWLWERKMIKALDMLAEALEERGKDEKKEEGKKG